MLTETTKELIESLKPSLSGKKILLGMTGSIAAYKCLELIRLLKQAEAQVKVILTESAKKFVTTATIETLSQEKVGVSLWEEERGTHHIDRARWADAIVIAPATANILSKLATGQADDLLTTECLAFHGPLFIAPAMNPTMFRHPAVQENVRILKERNVFIEGPDFGETACGEEGLGRMVEVDQLFEAIAELFFSKKPGKKILINLGPTRSYLDPVRYLTNRSSGRMGAALCWAAIQKGHQVSVVSGSRSIRLPRKAEVKEVETSNEMATEVFQLWKKSDIFLAAAAVLDWEFRSPFSKKAKKDLGSPNLELKASVDILKEIVKLKKSHQYVLGFAAETEDLIKNAKAKLQKKGCDSIFVNEVGLPHQGFDSKLNQGWWISDQTVEIPRCTKITLARILLDLVEKDLLKGHKKKTHPSLKEPLRVVP